MNQEIKSFLNKMDDIDRRDKLSQVLNWITGMYPQLKLEYKWNQPMFTDHGTFIMGFSVAKKHFAFTPEEAGITQFAKQIEAAGYSHTKGIVRIPWDAAINYDLLDAILAWQIESKKDMTSFWRK